MLRAYSSLYHSHGTRQRGGWVKVTVPGNISKDSMLKTILTPWRWSGSDRKQKLNDCLYLCDYQQPLKAMSLVLGDKS